MNRNHKILIGVLVALVVVSGAAATYRYVTRPKPVPAPTAAQVTAQKNKELQAVKAADAAEYTSLQATNQQLTSQKTQACATLAKYRLVAPECK